VQRLHLVGEGESLRKTFRQDPHEYFLRALKIESVYARKGRHREARDQLRGLLAEPGVPERVEGMVRKGLAAAHAALGEIDEAKVQLGKVLEKTPDDGLAQSTLVHVYLQEKRYQDALDLLRKTLQMPGLLPQAELNTHWNLATVYARMGDLSRVEAEAEKALAVKEEDLPPGDRRILHTGVRVFLGRVHLQERRFAEAAAQAERVLKMDPEEPVRHEAGVVLAEVYGETGKVDQAGAEVSRVLASDPDNPAALHARASLAAIQGKDLEQAEADMKKLVEGEPANLWYQVTLAWVQALRGQTEQALAALEKLSRDDVVARSPAFFDILGDVYALARRPDRARESWQKALGLFPETTDKADRRRQAIRGKIESAGR
jgi:tetratricopeptide (TPR) repeat protein